MKHLKKLIQVLFAIGVITSSLNVLAQNAAGTVAFVSGATTGCGSVSGRVKVTGYTGAIEWQAKYGSGPWDFIWIDGNPPIKITWDTYDYSESVTTSYRVAVKKGLNYVYSNEVTVTVLPPSKGGTLSGAATYLLNGSGTLPLTGQVGQVVHWQMSTNGGSTWSTLASTSTSYSYSNVTQTTVFRAGVQNGTCPVVYSTTATVTIRTPGVISGPASSGEESPVTLTLQNYYNSIVRWEHSIDGGVTWINHAEDHAASFTYAFLRENTKFRVLVNMAEYGMQYAPEKSVSVIPFSQANPVSGVAGQNYVRVQTVRVAGVTNPNDVGTLPISGKHELTSFLDGQGRQIQRITKAASASSRDIVQFSMYTAANVSTQYLPYISQQADGVYKTGYLSEQSTFYSNGTGDKIADSPFPFAKNIYEQSPLSRILEQGMAGADWQPGGHTAKTYYGQNAANEVHFFAPEGTSTSFYGANELNKVTVVDENGNSSQLFKNKQGQVILKRTQLDETVSGTNIPWLETYYIYNASGDVKFIMTPKGVVAKNSGSWSTHSAQFMNQHMYQFVYDDLGRLVEKKVPGQAWIYYCYDQLDRLVLMQDGYLRALKKWNYYKYDRLGRPIMQGLYTNSAITSRVELQQTVLDPLYQSSTEKYYEERGSASHGYTNQTFPTTAIEVQIVKYFDDYDFDFNGTDDYAHVSQGLAGEGTPYIANGRLVGYKVLILGTSTWLSTYLFYDKKGQVIQTLSNNHLSAVIDNRATQVYDFEGRVLLAKNYHNAGSGRTTTVLNRFVYDAQGRLLKVFQNNNSASVDQLMVQYEYNEIGQLIDKKLHETVKDAGTFIQSVDYRYSIRGWLESINNAQLSNDGVANDDLGDYFGIEFAYNTPVASLTSAATVFYDGKVSSSRWKSLGSDAGNERQMSYVYKYDKANRLKGAESKMYGTTGWTEEVGALNEEMTFDGNGNILTLKRNARQYQPSGSATSYGKSTIDDLQYFYASTAGGDFLTKVTDASASPRGFNNGTSGTANDYTYDLRGNLLTDANRGITSNITYNQLNKPSRVQYADGHKVDYVYDVNGNKLTMKSYDASNVLKKTTDYVLGFVYEDGVLDFFPSPEGKVINKEGNLEYQYSIADHLGNTRIVFSSVNPTQSPALATFEDAVADELTFDNINTSTMYWVSKSAANHTPSGQYVMRMNNSYATGPGKAISVFPGDAVAIEVWSYFEGASGFGGSNQPLNSLITSVAGAFGGVAGGAGESGMIYNAVNSAYTVFGLPANRGDDVPTAHLNYILFDRDYNLLDMGWEPVPSNANMSKQRLSFDAMKIQEAGYMYIYLSYDGQGTNWVYFDDLKITHSQTNVVQYNAYYPFGLVADGSWTRTNYENDHLYNAGSELNRTHGWYETFYRNYDPIIGRFLSIDPLALNNESLTSFQYAANNPVLFNDPRGDTQNPAMPWVGDTGGSSNDEDDTFNSSWIDGLSSDFIGAIYGSGSGDGGGGTSLSDFFRAITNSSFGGSWENGSAIYFKSDRDEADWALDHLSGLSDVEPWAFEKLRDIRWGIKRDPKIYSKPPVVRQQSLTQAEVNRLFRDSFINDYISLLRRGQASALDEESKAYIVTKILLAAETILFEKDGDRNLGIIEISIYERDAIGTPLTSPESIYTSPTFNALSPVFLSPGQTNSDGSFGLINADGTQYRIIVKWQETRIN